MKKIIIESGSSKADVVVFDDGDTRRFRQEGMNPSVMSELPISDILIKYLLQADTLYFYGAGVSTQADKETVIKSLKAHNVGLNIEAYSDLIGACRSTEAKKKSIVCILGTGSNSCLYNGKDILEQIPTMGYVLGDEGGGTDLGRRILKAYYHGKMPKKIAAKFEKSYNLDYDYVKEQLYRSDHPNRFLASHAAFLKEIKGKWKKELLNESFQSFIDYRVKPYQKFNKRTVYFIGSIAYYYKKRLKKVCAKNGIKNVVFIKRPIKSLESYHKKLIHDQKAE